MVERALPSVEQLLDIPALRVAELELGEDVPRLVGIVVRDRSLEMLPERGRLLKLPSQPAEEAYLRGFHMGGDGLEPPTLCV